LNLIKQKIWVKNKTTYQELIKIDRSSELKMKNSSSDYFCHYFSNTSLYFTLHSSECPPHLYIYIKKKYVPLFEDTSVRFALATPNEHQSAIIKLGSGNSFGLNGLFASILKKKQTCI